MTHALTNSAFDESKLSAEGQQLIQDCKQIIEDARQIVLKKNPDENIQNFIHHTTETNYDVAAPKAGPSKDQLKDHGQTALQHLQTIGKLIVTNGEFRKILSDSQYILRDVLADGAANAANLARPDEEKLAQVDHPAPADVFHDAEGTKGPNDSIANPSEAEQIKNAANSAQDKATEIGNVAANHVDKSANQLSAQADAGANKDEVASQAASQAKSLKNKIGNLIPEQHKEKVDEHVAKTKDYFKQKFPEERRNQFIYRLKKMIAEIQKHKDFQEAVDFFLDIAETYGGHAKEAHGQTTKVVSDFRSDPHWSESEKELRTILENFANNKSMTPMLDAFQAIYDDAQKDPNLKQFFKDWDTYIRRLLKEHAYVLNESSTTDGKALVERGQKLLGEDYKPHTDNILNQVRDFFTAMGEDPVTKKLGDDFKALWRHLFYDEQGSLKYKPHLWQDVRQHILPEVFATVRYIPIPRIEYSDPMFDIVIENLILESENFLPNLFEVYNENYFKFSTRKEIKDFNSHTIRIKLEQIQADMRDVHFYYRKKNGVHLKDEGLADIFLGGKGLSVDVKVSTADHDPKHVLKVKSVKCKVDNLKFKIRKSRHQILYATVRPLVTTIAKKQVAKAIEDAIKGGFERLDSQLVEVNRRVEEAKKEKPDGASSIAQRGSILKSVFVDEPKEEAAQKAENATQDRKFRIVSKRDSVFGGVGSINKAFKQKRANGTADVVDAEPKTKGWKDQRFDITGKKTTV